ncbi:hypothetical protein H7170_03485 [Candidatus Gracilibacteria bacterium]|nr:hypothetical protein [Candidatus Gracilibacteria bacterium]
MLTRTLPSPEVEPTVTENTESPEFIEQQVDERGFYLYEWISPDELRMSVLADYLAIIRAASTPLAVVTLIAGFIRLSAGVPGVILAVLGVLGIFYTLVLAVLIAKMLRKSYLYTRGGNVVITDGHYISAGTVVERSDFAGQKKAFGGLEKTFREPLLEPSGLAEHIAMERASLIEQMKSIASGGGKLVQNLGRSRDAAGIVMVLMIAGLLYGGMMALVYFLGVFFVSVMARVFSWLAHRALLALNNTEHEIQTLFQGITRASIALKSGQKQSISLLTDAGRGEWTDNLSARLRDSFEVISEMAGEATDQTVELRDILESSRYKDIFNFVKYGKWIQGQVLSPIEEILLLLTKNRDTITRTIASLDTQIILMTDPSHQKPLILQKDRFEMQIESITPMIEMLEGYKAKLKN